MIIGIASRLGVITVVIVSYNYFSKFLITISVTIIFPNFQLQSQLQLPIVCTKLLDLVI